MRASALRESQLLLGLGLPIILTQVAQASLGFIDTLVAGRYSTLDLAAVALGNSIWMPLFLAVNGIIMATTPLVAHAIGAKNAGEVPTVFRQGLWISAFLGLLGLVLLRNADGILALMSVEATLADKTMEYLKAVAWGFPAMGLYQLLRCYFEGLGRTRPAMYIAFLAVAANAPLNYLLVFGKLGFPELGAAGCGIATALVMWMMLFIGLYLQRHRSTLRLPHTDNLKLIDLSALIVFLKLGIPIGFSILIEASMFSIIALILAPLGTFVVAAQQITITVTGLIFMIPLSLAMAFTIRVGQLLGAGEYAHARFASKVGFGMTGLIAVVTSVLLWSFAQQIAMAFSTEAEVIKLAASLLTIAALFEISDAMQVTAAGILRGYKDTSIPLLIVFVAYWGVGLPLGYILGMTDWITAPMGAAGFWYALVIGLTVSALFLTVRLVSVIRHVGH